MDICKQIFDSVFIQNLATKIATTSYENFKSNNEEYMRQLKLVWRDSGIQYCFMIKQYAVLPDNAG